MIAGARPHLDGGGSGQRHLAANVHRRGRIAIPEAAGPGIDDAHQGRVRPARRAPQPHPQLSLPKTQSGVGRRWPPMGRGTGVSVGEAKVCRWRGLGHARPEVAALAGTVRCRGTARRLNRNSGHARPSDPLHSGRWACASGGASILMMKTHRRCAEKQQPYRGRVIRPGAVPEIIYPTRDAFAPRDNRKSRIAGAA